MEENPEEHTLPRRGEEKKKTVCACDTDEKGEEGKGKAAEVMKDVPTNCMPSPLLGG